MREMGVWARAEGGRDDGYRAASEAVMVTPQRMVTDRLESSSAKEQMQPMTEPLFDEAQLRRFDEIHRRAPWLYQPQVSGAWHAEVQMGQASDELRLRELEVQRLRDLEVQRLREQEEKRQIQARAYEMRLKSDEEILRMRERLAELEEENLQLRSKEAVEWGRSSRYVTPEESAEVKETVEVIKREEEATRGMGEMGDSEPRRDQGQAHQGGHDDMKGILHGMVKLMEGRLCRHRSWM